MPTLIYRCSECGLELKGWQRVIGQGLIWPTNHPATNTAAEAEPCVCQRCLRRGLGGPVAASPEQVAFTPER